MLAVKRPCRNRSLPPAGVGGSGGVDDVGAQGGDLREAGAATVRSRRRRYTHENVRRAPKASFYPRKLHRLSDEVAFVHPVGRFYDVVGIENDTKKKSGADI